MPRRSPGFTFHVWLLLVTLLVPLELAKEKYVAAWEASRPNGQALLSAGFAARKLGQHAEAQRLFDRAIVDGEKGPAKRGAEWNHAGGSGLRTLQMSNMCNHVYFFMTTLTMRITNNSVNASA